MANTPTYLPVYQLSQMVTPTDSDYLVVQSAATNGDVGLLLISTFKNTFLQPIIDDTEIDSTVTDYFTSIGWTAPT